MIRTLKDFEALQSKLDETLALTSQFEEVKAGYEKQISSLNASIEDLKKQVGVAVDVKTSAEFIALTEENESLKTQLSEAVVNKEDFDKTVSAKVLEKLASCGVAPVPAAANVKPQKSTALDVKEYFGQFTK